jgi:predicted alpha/beta-fold hydrolase
VQTLSGKLLRRPPDAPVDRMRVETPDGDFLDLDVGQDPGPGSPVVLILHGLEGSSRRAYVRTAAAALTRRGILPVAMNCRACSGVPNRLTRFYHSGDTGDPGHVLETLRERFPGRPLGALGFSLGGNMLLRLLAELGPSAPVDLRGAVAISVPYDLARGADMLEQGLMGRFYAGYFLRSLRRKIRSKASLLRDVIDVNRALAARTIREFDDAATAPLHGFPGAAEYYERASSGPILSEIRVPTYLIHAEDDPFLPGEALPGDALATNPWLVSAFTDRGGHVGFLERIGPGGATFWVEDEAARYLAEVLGRAPSK